MALHEVTPFEEFLETALYYLGIVLFVAVPALTAFWAWAAHRCSRKAGYLWLMAFALTPYLTWSMNRLSYHIHREEIAKINAQRRNGVMIVERTASLPIYQLILAAGVFLLYRVEKRTANNSPEATPGQRSPAEPRPSSGAPHL